MLAAKRALSKTNLESCVVLDLEADCRPGGGGEAGRKLTLDQPRQHSHLLSLFLPDGQCFGSSTTGALCPALVGRTSLVARATTQACFRSDKIVSQTGK